MKSKKKTSIKKTTKKTNELFLELNGNVYIVEKKDGKEVSREELSGKIVLDCVLNVLGQAMDSEETINKIIGK